MLSLLGPIIWLLIPPKDENAEWHERKPWQRRHKPREAEMAGEAADAAPHRDHEGLSAERSASSRSGCANAYPCSSAAFGTTRWPLVTISAISP